MSLFTRGLVLVEGSAVFQNRPAEVYVRPVYPPGIEDNHILLNEDGSPVLLESGETVTLEDNT